MPKINKEKVRQYMLGLIRADDGDFVKKTVDAFGVARSTVYNYVKKLCEEGVIQKSEQHDCGYTLVYRSRRYSYQNEGLREDIIFRRDIAPLLEGFAPEVIGIWNYAFTEMMNNAIEHSRTEKILVVVSRSAYDTVIMLDDDGTGIFQNIRDYYLHEKREELLLEECVALLFAGKFTTMRNQHSGEGIFFTSHMMDSFRILSDHILFSRDNFRDDMLIGEDVDVVKGTTVLMSLNNQSRKTSREVFDRFSDIDGGFTRTHLPIAHIFPGGNPVSRSEARRLTAMVEEFKEITLDYENVEEIGQAFAHELYVVWRDRRPEVVLINENASDVVLRMIAHAEHSR